MKRSLFAVIFLCAVLFLPAQAWAVQGIGLSPALKEVSIGKDETSVSFDISVANTTEQRADLKLRVLDFGALDDSGGIAFVGRTAQESATRGLREWMELDEDTLTLNSGESRDVKVTIENRDTLSPGGHYGAVVVSAANPGSGSDSVAVLPAASTLVLLKKTDGENYSLKLDELKANSSLINLPKSATMTFRNEGNTHVVPRGVVELKNPFGKLVARGTINETSSFVLPDSSRRLTVEMMSYSQPWLPGRYRLETTWRYDGTDKAETVVYHKFFIGKMILVVIFMLCTIFVLFMYVQARRRPPVRGL